MQLKQLDQFTLSLDANLVQSSEYEADKSSQTGIIINGQATNLNQVVGNDNGGSSRSTGLRSYNLSFNANSCNQTVSLFCRNSKKTYNNENTVCTFDNVVIQ